MSEFEEKLSAILGNPEAMNQIMGIAQTLNSGTGGEAEGPSEPFDDPPESGLGDPFSLLSSLDPRIMQTAMTLLAEYNTNDDSRANLLHALRPFVKRKRFKKIDRAVQIAKISRLIRVALTSFQGGDGDV